jgi:YD repeat-containing protein
MGKTFLMWLSSLVLLLAVTVPASAATTTPNPRIDYCWDNGTSVGNTNAEIYGDRHLTDNCFSTVNEFYDAMVSTIQLKYNEAWPSGKTGRCDVGSCYDATYATTSTFAKYGYGQVVGQGQYNNCIEPASPAAASGHAYCGLKRTDTTTWTCTTASCQGWNGVVQVTEVQDANLHAFAGHSCQDARLMKTGTNKTAGTCANIVNIFPGLEECKYCQGTLKGGNPIYPMTGAKKEVVPTGLSIGGQSFFLTYYTLRHLMARADGLVSAAQLNDLPSFGALWTSSFHRRLNIRAGSVGIESYRGDGRIVGFGLTAALTSGGTYVPSAGVNDTLTIISGGYRYFDASAGVIETYNSAGQITAAAGKDGNALTFTYSTAAGPTVPAAGYLTQVTDNTGRSISFAYILPAGGVATSDGLVSTITASDGRTITAAYDTAKNLSSLTWQDSKVRTFLYENVALPWALTGKRDENNVRLSTWVYDSGGRAVASDDALGTNHYSAAYNTPPQAVVTETLVVGNGLNYANTYYRHHTWQAPTGLQLTGANGATANADVVLPNGYPVLAGLSQPAGSGSLASNKASTFDANGNLLSHDDFQGQRTCYAYDSKNQQVTRVEGLSVTTDCATVTPTTAALPAGSRKYTTTWDSNWRTPKLTTQPGSVTTWVYQGQPDPKNGNATANCSPAAALANGAPLNLLCKSVVEMAGGAYFDNPSASGGDPQIDKVVLLLHGEDGGGSPVLADSSSYRKNQTSRWGSAAATTAQSKFGTGSISLDSASGGAFGFGPDDNLKITGDFTIEMFVKLNAQANTARTIFGWGGDPWSGQATGAVAVDGSGNLYASWTGGSISGPAISTGVWHHVALSRSNGTWVMHLNGVQAGATVASTNSAAFNYGRFELGRGTYMTFGNLNGYLDEVRVTNGIARYGAAFTPPAQQFGDPLNLNPAQPKVADAHYLKNTLLLHADGVNGSKTVVDSSPLANTGTIRRNGQVSTADSKFGGSSFYIPGSTDYGDYASVTGDHSLPGDFTVEFWMKPSSTTAHAIPIRIGGGGAYDDFYFAGDSLGLQRSDGTSCPLGGNLASLANTWIHVAYVRVGSTVYSYVNGKANGNCTRSTTVGNANGMVFGFNATSNAIYYDDIRITKGQARYTAAFIPSAYPAPNVATLSADASTVTTQYTYDAAGRMLTSKDTLNRTTTYAYYTATAFTGTAPNEVGRTLGDLQSITNAAGHVTQFTQYDRAGRVRQMIDPKGVVTDTVYTPRGWIASTTVTPPGGAARTTTYSYDNAGQLTGVVMPDASTLAYSYDAAHRLTGVTDAKGNTVTYALDNMGNRVGEQVKDPQGNLQRNITRVYDALNRVQQTTGAAN